MKKKKLNRQERFVKWIIKILNVKDEKGRPMGLHANPVRKKKVIATDPNSPPYGEIAF